MIFKVFGPKGVQVSFHHLVGQTPMDFLLTFNLGLKPRPVGFEMGMVWPYGGVQMLRKCRFRGEN